MIYKTTLTLMMSTLLCTAQAQASDAAHQHNIIRRFKVEKLIRDKMPAITIAEGLDSHERIMDEQEYLTRLLLKLHEEASEVCNAATRAEQVEEMADVLEVLYALAKHYDISPEEIESKRLEKRARRGSFAQRFYSPYVDVPDEHPMTAYYQARPTEYPEIPLAANNS